MGIQQDKLPFHESIIKIIKEASGETMLSLVDLIKITEIPRNHDEIITAWNTRWQELGLPNLDVGVETNLLKQKQEAEEKKRLSDQSALETRRTLEC